MKKAAFGATKNLPLDAMDRHIFSLLSMNARTSNREIARALAVTERTIRVRLKRLIDARIIHIGLVTHAGRLAESCPVTLWVDVEDAAQVGRVARELAALPSIVYVATLLGRCDIVAAIQINASEQLQDRIREIGDHIAGLQEVRFTLPRQFVKHDYRWARIG